MLNFVFADAGVAFAAPSFREAGVSQERVNRPFRSVGIYSLLESATRVAAEWIHELFPGCEIKTSSEHVNSESLTALVKASDVMLVQTSHAKHAATQAIAVASSDPSRLVIVHGRGATAPRAGTADVVRGGNAVLGASHTEARCPR